MRNSNMGARTPTKSRKQSYQSDFGDQQFRTPQQKSQKNASPADLSKSAAFSTFQNHHDECLCKDCLCGRHLCKLQAPILSMTLNSTYKAHYPPRTPYKHQRAVRPVSARLPATPLLSGRSTYLDDFIQLQGDAIQRPKPEDLLKCKKGSVGLTSYNQQFPGHRGKNQYVPVSPELFRGGLDFSGTSNYSKQFGHQRGKSAQNAKPADQFRMNGSWLGESNYKDQFQNPQNHVSKGKKDNNPQMFTPTKSKVSSTSQKNPSSHFKTTYGSDFRGNKRSVCPAALKAIELEQCLTKSSFKENTDFKGFDSKYSSIAKHGRQF